MVSRVVLMMSGLVSVNTARQVNVAHSKTTVNAARPMSYLSKIAHSTVKKPIHNTTAFKNSNINQRVNTARNKKFNTVRPKAVVNVVKGNNFIVVKASACWVWKPKTNVLDHVSKHNSASITLKKFDYGNPQMGLQDQGVIDSGCSRHMTRNMSYLTYYKEIDGGYVAFGGNHKGGKITRKCTIKTGNLDFENVYFMRELKFNLFSVSQMCDKKNSVLFNDTECIVLSPNFKLIDESQVLLRVPRKNNMYSVDLKNIVPKGGLTCLFAKATSDESKLWHRRLGHLNFKTMNKLVKGNLVRGLPSKLFENDQTCVACQKGKQHRASCKSKTENSISLPLHLLHMDLFGPTFVKSLMKKMYCLVVTDDYSRFTWVFFLATKDETSGILKSFITGIENLVDHKVKVIRCDNGTEFKNKEMNQFCEMKGTMAGVDVDTLTMEQYLALSRENQAPGVPLKTWSCSCFPFNSYRSIKRWVDRLAPGTINTWDLLKKAFIQRYCPPSMTAKQLEDIHNFKQEGDESFKPAWDRLDTCYNNALPSTSIVHQKVGCQICEGPYLDKDCPLNQEVKQVEEADNRPPYGDKRQILEELLAKHQEESARRSTKMEIKQLTKEIHSDKILNSSSEQIKTVTSDQETSGLNKLHGVSFISGPGSNTPEVLQHQLPPKELNPGSFTLPYTIGKFNFYAMVDLGASINVVPRSIFEHLHLIDLKKKNMLCEMADMSKKAPLGIVENVLVKIDKFLFPADFVILDNTPSETTILGRPLLATIHAKIDVYAGKISLGINENRISFNTMRKDHNYANPSEKNFMVRPQSPGQLIIEIDYKSHVIWTNGSPNFEIGNPKETENYLNENF
ncbi:putative ribonuclease H-like domain-containing protein [Tanacetum coccineum]